MTFLTNEVWVLSLECHLFVVQWKLFFFIALRQKKELPFQIIYNKKGPLAFEFENIMKVFEM